MTQFVAFDGEPTTTPDKILWATYRALHQYGYTGLSIQRIADFTGISKSSIYYHYEDKDDLLLTFLEQVLQDVHQGLEVEAGAGPVEDLQRFIARIFASIAPERKEPTLPLGAYIEIRAQATSNAAYEKRITEIDAALREQLRSILRQGLDQGVIQNVDVEAVSEYLLTTIIGAMERHATSDTVALNAIKTEIDRYLDRCVIL